VAVRRKGASTPGAFEAGLAEAVRALVPVRSARLITQASGVAGADTNGADSGRLRFAVPVPAHPGLGLEVQLDPTRGLDGWDRQLLRDAARVLGLAVMARRDPEIRSPEAPSDLATPIIGSSACMQRLRQQIERVAATDFTVLIAGESGSGKELVARQVHELSARRRGPFVAVNCAALVETLVEAELFGIEDRVATGVRARQGKFEAADRGTLFLDEVADLSPSAQAKLLRAAQELAVERVGGHQARPVDIRMVVATNQRLQGLVSAGRFRADLYYRLAGVELPVPPLRCRREDIAELVDYFLARHRGLRHLTLSNSAGEALLTYDWPGNVRELQRVVERALALTPGDVVGLSDLPPELTSAYAEVLHPSVARGESMRAWGSRYARLVLERHGRNKRRTCEALGISYHTLQSYLRYRVTDEHVQSDESTGASNAG
jgi:transcriptional regulator with PAS, ATPase and Fis domain